MLRLRKVELLGFKSFCEKTQMTYSGNGVTCIVGPNGCGKSNIVDAISWVLGEQSHKSLRAERMSDCIFNGTAKRAPMGFAQVSLTLVDPDLAEAAAKVLEGVAAEEGAEPHAEAGAEPSEPAVEEAFAEPAPEPGLPAQEKPARRKSVQKQSPATKPGEVVIGRRLYRSGLSEYLLNGRVARLRDIQELFMGMGLGPDTYAIIEQGRIGQILSSKPMDRRAIIEEAAGITKFKTKKRLAEAKLESSKINLARVNDILVEVEKQLASLKRQASKARRYAELREQMRALLRQVLASKAAELDSEAERLGSLLKEIAAREAEKVQAIAQLETEQQRLTQRTYELEAELRQNQNLLGQAALELDRSENRIGFNQQKAQELETRGRQLSSEMEQVAGQALDLQQRVAAHCDTLAALREQSVQLEQLLAQFAERTQQLNESALSTEARISELRAALGQLGDALTQLHGERAQAEQALAHQLEAQGRQEAVERQLLEEAVQFRERAEVADLYCQESVQRVRGLEQAVRDAQERITGLRRGQQEAQARLESARDTLAGARARHASLEQILNDRSYTAEAVQKLFASNGEGSSRGFRAVGVLADYAEVEEQYETPVEQFLREELEYVVVETIDHANAGIALLREEVGGRATFFVDSLRHLDLPEGEPVRPFTAPGVVSRLDRLVEFRDPLGPAAKRFLPRLKSAYLVETAAVAESLARENPDCHFVTPEGTCYQGRMVSGGRPDEAGPLVMKRELRRLSADVLRLERAAAESHAAAQQIEEELHAADRALEQSAAQKLEAEKNLVAATHQREQARAELARMGVELSACQKEIDRLRTEAQAARRRAEQAERQYAEATESRTATEKELTDASERLGELRKLLAAHQEELAAKRAEAARLAERRASADLTAARLAEDRSELETRLASLEELRASLLRERQELETQTVEQLRQVETLREEKARLEARMAELEREFDQARVNTVQVDDALRAARQTLGDLREQRSQHEIERARNESDVAHLRETCLAELNAHPEDLIVQQPELLAGETLAAAETNYREMKARTEAMGPVNMMALEEFNECEQRYTFLSRERDDLLQSIADTQQAIAELDVVSRQKFEEAFAAVNRNFAEAFRALFGGGTGEMRLTEPDSSGETGIDIVAQPPGKRLQNVLLLSGGEKALTALALLIAIFRYQPSPFCILDEVDAPLDDANIGRFTRMITEMSAQTQFLIVTHNRRTMEMGSVLYGVTMQEPGVSKLVSVRWDEPAAANAAASAA